MSEKVNLHVDPSRENDKVVYAANGSSDEESELLTERVREMADLDSYIERNFERDDPNSHFVGTVTFDGNGNVNDVRVASRVVENPLA